jgi:hypothetical protein
MHTKGGDCGGTMLLSYFMRNGMLGPTYDDPKHEQSFFTNLREGIQTFPA